MIDTIPDYTKTNFSVDKDAAKQMIDWGVAIYNERSITRANNEKMYNSYNGIVDTSKLKNITAKTGSTSATPFISYRLGRNKIKQLIGEFLQIGLRSTVFSINPEARNEKYEKYITQKMLSYLKPEIEKVRQMGGDIYPGVAIDDSENIKITNKNFKTKNEIIMQHLLDYFIQKDDMLSRFSKNWIQLILTSEVGGKLERDISKKDNFRAIDPSNGIFLEAPDEIIVKRSPIVGEKRLMFKHEIIQEFNLDATQQKELDNIGKESSDMSLNRISGQYLYPVYSLQWLGRKIIRRKSGKNKRGIEYIKFINEEYFERNKNKIDKEIENGKYKIIDENIQYTVFEGSVVGSDMYIGIQEKENNIVWTDESGTDHVEFDYIFGLFNTVGGVRIPLQEVVHEMEKVYNAIRRQLNVEISKLRGSHAIFDEAFLGKKTVSKIIYELGEHGVSSVNSSKLGMTSDDRESIMDRVVKDFSLGDHQTIQTLMQLAMDIEQALDRQMGMNDARQGLANASSTATANQNNVNASMSMTYDMFHFMQIYMNEVLSRLVEKIKINWDWLENQNKGFILSDEELGFLKATRELSNDSYGIIITDGKLEYDISRKLESYFLQDINSSRLRTVDVAKFYTTKSFHEGLKVLKDAYNEIVAIQQQSDKAKMDSQNKGIEAKINSDKEWREDEQQSRKEEIVLKSKSKENEILTKAKVEKGIMTESKLRDQDREIQKEQMKTDREANNEIMSE